MEIPVRPPEPRRASPLSLVGGALLFAASLVAVVACGDGDLVFPGMTPPTNTPGPTATPVPDDDV